jgi:hypothetical protein
MEKDDLIPSQQIGKQTDAVKEKRFSSSLEAKDFFHKAVSRLLNVNHWHRISTIEASRFQLFDNKGSALERIASDGDFIRIDIPCPGISEGKGYDWVHIESMEKYSNAESDTDFTVFVARPCSVPGEMGNKTAHFFTRSATSTFLVFRKGETVSAEVHGRNEVPYVHQEGILDNVRNIMVNAGNTLGMSYLQWDLLVSGILSQ